MKFNRVYRLTFFAKEKKIIIEKNRFDVNGLNVSFKINYSSNLSVLDYSSIAITGLKLETIEFFLFNDIITLDFMAGYDNNLLPLATGMVLKKQFTRQNNGEVTVVIFFVRNIDFHKTKLESKTFKKGTPLLSVLKYISSGLIVEVSQSISSINLSSNYAVFGKKIKVLNELKNKYNLKYKLEKEKLTCYKEGEGQNYLRSINGNNGMIGFPVLISLNQVKFTVELDPTLDLFHNVKVDTNRMLFFNDDLNINSEMSTLAGAIGNIFLDEVVHVGSLRGDKWQTECVGTGLKEVV